MRILHILRDLDNVGNGVINAGVELACVQSRLGETVAMASPGGHYSQLLTQHNVAQFQLLHGGSAPISIRSCRQFRAIINDFDPDIVHSHVVSGVCLARFARGTSKYRLISHIHNVQNKSSQLLRLADATIAVSTAVAADMINRHFPAKKLLVVQNRFVGSLRMLGNTKPEPKSLKQPAIVTVAGMSKRKNIDGLIRAFSIVADPFPEANLYLVGDGPDRQQFENLAALSPFSNRIHFEGFQKDPRPYLESAHIFVLASHRDSSPLVIHEARELGSAIIATDVDGIPEALDFGSAGILVSHGNVNALAEAIHNVLSDPSEHLRLKQAAVRNLANHSVWRMASDTLEAYRSVINGQSGAQLSDSVETI